MQTSETGADTGSTVTLQTSVAGQAAVPTQVVQQVPVQQQVGDCYFCEKKIRTDDSSQCIKELLFCTTLLNELFCSAFINFIYLELK